MHKKPWRAGWRGRLLGIHSISAHGFGTCWCQKKTLDMCFDCRMALQDIKRVVVIVPTSNCSCCISGHASHKEA